MQLSKAPKKPESEAVEPMAPAKRGKFLKVVLLILLMSAIAALGYLAWTKFGTKSGGGGASVKPVATQEVNGLKVTLIHSKGQLEHAMNEVFIEFLDTATGELVDVGTVKFDLDMNMAGMVMHSGATIDPTSTPGRYRARVKPDMVGEWMGTLAYDGPRGSGKVSFSVNVKQ
jgi:hypothetical protein